MPRVYARVTRNTGVSFGTFGFLVYLMGWMTVAAVVIALAALAVAAIVVAFLVAIVVGAIDALIHRDRRALTKEAARLTKGLNGAGELRANQARYSDRR
jgi:hypothetical protein